MRHIKSLSLTLTCVLIAFVVMANLAFWGIDRVIRGSQFRLAQATHAGMFSGKRVNLVLGDSRMMDGVNAEQFNKGAVSGFMFNAAFNGMELPETLATLESFVGTCSCRLGTVMVDETALWEESPGVSETEVFLAAFDPQAMKRLLDRNPERGWFLKLLPALHFNNEVTHRSLYYLLRGANDQGQSNEYRFRVPAAHAGRMGVRAKENPVKVEDVREFNDKVAAAGGKLVVVIPPHHPTYTESRIGYDDYVRSVRDVVERAGARFLDDSRLYIDRPDVFSDLIHLHSDGQALYTHHLLESGLFSR